MLTAIVQDASKKKSLMEIHLVTICLLAFVGFFRYDEIVSIKSCDVRIFPDHMVIQIPQIKTDQLRQGDEVVISRSGSIIFPVAMIEHYINRANINLSSEQFLFRPIVNAKTPRLRDDGKLSYSRFSELLKEKLTDLGFQAAEFSPQSQGRGS